MVWVKGGDFGKNKKKHWPELYIILIAYGLICELERISITYGITI
jgi:hypothetical protein